MVDRFQNHSEGLTSPGARHWQITPHDTNPLDPRPRAIYCASEGDVVILDKEGTALTYSMVAGEVLDFRAYIVHTDTTATVYGWD